MVKEKLSKETWLAAGFRSLAESGPSAIRINALANTLGATKGSFYWHFKDLSDLNDAIVEMWQSRNTGIIIQRCAEPAQSLCEGLFHLIDCWLDTSLFDAPLDLAIRNWARNDPDLQLLVDRSDADRLRAATGLFERFGTSKDVAHFRALTVLLTQTGYHSMRVDEPRNKRAQAACQYVEIFAGQTPTEGEQKAFLARHTGTDVEGL